jgi:glycosyltransferase involved in cell wall biosynthesis
MHDRADVQLEVVLLDDGPLLDELRELAPVTVLREWRLEGRSRYLPSIGARVGGARGAQVGRQLALRPHARHVERPDVVWVNTAGSIRALRYLPFHPPHLVTQVHELSLGLDRYLRAEDRALIEQHTDRYLTVSTPVTEHLVQRWGVARERIGEAAGVVELPPPPPTRDPGSLRREAGASPDDLVVGASGTVDWRKAPDLFLSLARAVRARTTRRVVLLWLGGGDASPLWEAMQEAVGLMGLADDVVFVGEQPDPVDWLRALDLFVLPSREDAFPLVCLEAASVGVPVVCFDTGGIGGFVAPDGEPAAGAVVPFPDLTAFTDEVVRLLADDQARQQAGEHGRRRVAERHSVEVGSEALLRELAGVAQGTPRG